MATTATSASANGRPANTEGQRFEVAIRILLYAFVVLSVLTVVALLMIGLPVIFNKDATTATAAYQSIKDLFAIVLPLLGTWVGTILAFYFGQKNYEAATQGTIELHKQLHRQKKNFSLPR
jgi:hypothetical protein